MAPTRYTEVESRLVRKQIAEGSYDDVDHRQYVDDLVALDRYVRTPPRSFGAAMHFGVIRNRHPGAYDIVQEELDPEGYEQRKRREVERRAEMEAALERSDEETAVERREWARVAESFEPR
jgi:hypothetical protein